MTTIAGFQFPETEEDMLVWKPYMIHTAIHSKVLLVARTRIEGAWSCYCVPVPGRSHEAEVSLWQTEGVKIRKELARAVFGCFENLPYDYLPIGI